MWNVECGMVAASRNEELFNVECGVLSVELFNVECGMWNGCGKPQ